MSREKQIKTTDWLTRGIPKEQLEREKQEAIMSAYLQECFAEFSFDFDAISEKMVAIGYRKQSEGEWVFEVNHYFDDYSGDLRVYATAHCGECGEKYPFNSTVAREYVDRPNDLIGYEEWNIDVEPIKAKVLQNARTNKNLYPFCPKCGARMKGGAE